MDWKSLLVLASFVCISFLFFGLSLDNDFWSGYDFVILQHSVSMMDGSQNAFDSTPPFKFQPIVYSICYLLFRKFVFNAQGYFLFNILLHSINSFLVYLLVNTLLKDRLVSILSGLLFVFTVGSYGKSVMITSGVEDLIITFLTLSTMVFYFKNELDGSGRVMSGWYFLTLLFFIASMFTRSTSFAILGCFVAFNFFFRNETGNPVFRSNLYILAAIVFISLIIKATVFRYTPPLYTRYPGAFNFVVLAGKNVINYLVRMIFPIHTSHLVTESGRAVQFVYRFATAIRILIALTVLSYSFFGFIFGNRTIRFFIAWTYIMVVPFAFFQFPNDWLNIKHLYMVSVGFVSVISAGAVYCSRLIASARWRRFVPFIVPVFFIIMSRFIVEQLDRSYESNASSASSAQFRELLAERFDSVSVDEEGRLVLRR